MITTTPLTFAEFKRLVNSIDESHWGTFQVDLEKLYHFF